jgi:hypothetical protein
MLIIADPRSESMLVSKISSHLISWMVWGRATQTLSKVFESLGLGLESLALNA